ncbi:MAG: TlpA family protein disulfide reductase [Limisphaerales bacterium]
MNFWATWCPPCLDEIPDFINLLANGPVEFYSFPIRFVN